MKTFELKNSEEINKVVSHFNYFHDASLIEIQFNKNREIDKDTGSLVYPYSDISDFINCDVTVLLLHNNYNGARKNQEVQIIFGGTRGFSFNQSETYDYSDIFELKHVSRKEEFLRFEIFATEKRIKFLEIICKEFKIIEGPRDVCRIR